MTERTHPNSGSEFEIETGPLVKGMNLGGDTLAFKRPWWWKLPLCQETQTSRVHIMNQFKKPATIQNSSSPVSV